MSQAPRLRVAPRAGRGFGDLAGDFAGDYGLKPDPWQQLVLDDWLAEKSGRWASLTCGLSCPRQNGKNALIEVRELFGMVGRGEKFLHTAHEVKTARKAFKRLQYFFGSGANDPGAKFPELNALVTEVRNVNGQEAIYLSNGGSVEIVARSKNSARGFSVDVLIMDEAQEMSDDDLEALMPTTSSAPLKNPQWIFTGTPPGPSANGEVFTRVRTEALEDKPARLAWHEWSAARDVDLDDRSAWRAVNPALINGRLQFEVIEGERARFSAGGFARERLGIWDDPQTRKSPFPNWPNCVTYTPPTDGTAPTAMGADMSHDRVISISGAWADDGDTFVELLEVDVTGDTAAAVEWLAQRAGHRIPVVIDSMSPAASMVPALKARRVRVITTSAADMGKACGGVHDAVRDGTLWHIDQDPLNRAVLGCKKRNIGTAGAWGLDRRDPETNIAPAVATVLAHFGAQVSKKRGNGRSTSGRRAVLL